MVTDGKSNGNIVKWVVDPFCDGNGNGKKQYQIHTHAIFLLPSPLPYTSCEQISNEIVAVTV